MFEQDKPAGGAEPVKPAPKDAPAPVQDGAVMRLTADHDSAMVELKVDGKTRMVPLKELRDGAQLRSAMEKRLREADSIKSGARDDVAFANRYKELLQTDPEAAIRMVQNDARKHGYQPPQPTQPRAAYFDDDDSEPTPARATAEAGLAAENAALLRRLDKLERQFQGAEAERETQGLQQRINRELDRQPIFSGDTEGHQRARELGQLFAASMHSADPSLSITEVVEYVTDKMAGLLTEKTRTDLTARRAQSRDFATLTGDRGTPAMLEPEEPVSWADAKKGKLKERMAAAYEKLQNSTNV
jgi:hypothetical protein